MQLSDTALICNAAYGDLDGDAQMHSSSSSDNESEAMFPSANDPTTPQDNAIFAELRQAELSPPSSQDAPHQNGILEDAMDVTDVQGFSEAGRNVQFATGRSHGEAQEVEKEPGFAWSNPRAREEFSRSMESVQDKDFSLRKYLFDCGSSGHRSLTGSLRGVQRLV